METAQPEKRKELAHSLFSEALSFRFQAEICEHLCPKKFSVISASLATLGERVVRMVISFNFGWKFERTSKEANKKGG